MLQVLICNYKCTFRTKGDTTNSFCSSCSSSTEANLEKSLCTGMNDDGPPW